MNLQAIAISVCGRDDLAIPEGFVDFYPKKLRFEILTKNEVIEQDQNAGFSFYIYANNVDAEAEPTGYSLVEFNYEDFSQAEATVGASGEVKLTISLTQLPPVLLKEGFGDGNTVGMHNDQTLEFIFFKPDIKALLVPEITALYEHAPLIATSLRDAGILSPMPTNATKQAPPLNVEP